MKKIMCVTVLCCVLSCDKDDTSFEEPQNEIPDIVYTYDNEGEDWFVGIGHPNTNDYDLDLDGVNDIRIINSTQFPEGNTGDMTAVAYFQIKQMFYIQILNNKLSIAIRDENTIVLDHNLDFITVGEEPTVANMLGYNDGNINDQLNYSSESMNSLLYINNFEAKPFLEFNEFGQVTYNFDVFAPGFPFGSHNWVNGFFSYPMDIYRPELPFSGQTLSKSGYIGFRIMDENNHPKYGWVELDFYVYNYLTLSYNFYPVRWYQVNVEVSSFALWNTPNIPLSIWDY